MFWRKEMLSLCYLLFRRVSVKPQLFFREKICRHLSKQNSFVTSVWQMSLGQLFPYHGYVVCIASSCFPNSTPFACIAGSFKNSEQQKCVCNVSDEQSKDWELTKHKEMSCTAAKANKPTHFVCLLLRRLVTAFFDWKTADVSSVHSVSICVKPSPLGKSAPTLFSPKIEEIFYVCNNRTFSNLPRYFRRLQAAFNTEASDIPIVSRFT